MSRIAALFLFFSLSATAWSVELPDFSFKGEEDASFNIRPVVREYNLSLPIPSTHTNFVNKQSISAASDEADIYGAEEPSFFYRFRPTTAIASIFNGDKAYRNYFVKLFLRENYQGVLDAHKDYKDGFNTPEYKEETRVLNAFSLLKMGDSGADAALAESCLNGEEFRNEACDKYMEFLWEKDDYKKIVEIGDKLRRPLPVYAFSVYLLSVFKEKEFDKAADLIGANSDLIFNYQDFNDLRAAAEYYQGNYETVTKLAAYCTDNISFIQADSYINLGRIKEAESLLEKVNPQSDKHFLETKIKIRQGKLKDAAQAIKSVKDETEKLELLNYYAATEFPKMRRDFLLEFTFESPDYTDYPVYYEGLQYFELKNYSMAAELLSRVQNSPDLIQLARFYRGIALTYIDPKRAEDDIIAIMNYSADDAQVAASRFMLAQAYYMKKEYDEAMQLLDGCTEQSCSQLRGEIFLQRGRYDAAIAEVEGVDSPQARLIRATAYYNKMEYGAARGEIKESDASSNEFMHLKMMLAFKEGDVAGGGAILTANQSYRPILYDGVKELMLVGEYDRAERLITSVNDLPSDMEIVSAKLMARSGKIKEARAIFTKLTKDSSVAYDAFSGIIALEKTPQGEIGAITSVLKELPRTPEFQQKDLLLSQMASKVSRAGENVLLIQIINTFFPDYADSPYADEMYAERARLFYATGRHQECLRDIDEASGKSPLIASELRFLRAQCTEAINIQDALTEYRAMFAEDDPFRLPAAVKIMDNSDNSSEVLSIAEGLKKENPQLYIEGIRRYAETAKPNELANNQKLIDSLLNDKSKALNCAGLFAKARVQNESGKGREAAGVYYQIYRVDPQDHFAAPALDAAITIYTKLKMPQEAAQMEALRGKIKKR